MSLFQPSSRQAFKAHAHVAGDLCPLCDQPIAQDIARKIAAKKREQYQAALDQARTEATAAAEQKVLAARAEAKQAAEAAVTGRLADIQSRLAQAEQAKATALAQMTTLKAAQEAAMEKRVAEIQAGLQRQKEDLQQEKEAAVLAEKAKVLKLQRSSPTCSASSRASRQTSSAKAPRSTCSRNCAMPSRETVSGASARASTAPT